MNVSQSLRLINELSKIGVEDYCVCPGGRNAPLVKALGIYPDIKVYSFYDERSAAFFAMGRVKADHKPVVVLTTSGTAVANLIPATVEAHYSYLPLILLTADRPQHYRGVGSPQSIEQVGIFSHYVEKTYDISVNSEIEICKPSRPIHINICFDEPLLSDFEEASKLVQNFSAPMENYERDWIPYSRSKSQLIINNFFETAKRPLVILGPGEESQAVKQYLLDWQWPFYAEGASGLREDRELEPLMLKGGEAFLLNKNIQKYFDSVIRIGPIPTLRLWRDLEFHLADWPVLHFSQQPFSGLSRSLDTPLSFKALDLISLKRNAQVWNEGLLKELLQSSHDLESKLQNLYKYYPLAETSWFQHISQWLPEESQVFIGNSLPIREWDLAATHKDKGFKIQCNRGANGIDGIISTALGWSKNNQQTFCILGDLSAMYDMNAYQGLTYARGKFHTIVINNGGGKIFSSMFSDEAFENRHEKSFAPLAKMFGLNYFRLENTSFQEVDLTTPSIIEVRPDNEQTKAFRQEYNQKLNF